MIEVENLFAKSPGPAELVPGTLHLWHFNSTRFHSQLDSLCNCLNDTELQRAAGYKFDAPRVRFKAARALLRRTLAHYLAAEASALRFGTVGNEKPTLLDGYTLQFNISHTADVVVIALAADRPVGVDVECIEPRRNMVAIAKHHFHEREVAQIEAVAEADHMATFYRIWTCKEAYLKGLGVGFAQPLSSFAMIRHSQRYRPEPELDQTQAGWTVDCAQNAGQSIAIAAPGQWQFTYIDGQ